MANWKLFQQLSLLELFTIRLLKTWKNLDVEWMNINIKYMPNQTKTKPFHILIGQNGNIINQTYN